MAKYSATPLFFQNFSKKFPNCHSLTFPLFIFALSKKSLMVRGKSSCVFRVYAGRSNMSEKNEIVVYQPENGEFHIDVCVENETVWLTQAQIAKLFGTQRPAITKHLANIYASQELEENSTCSVLEHVGNKGKQNYSTKYYNLDVILAIGYRVNSKNATLFRRWATQVLKDHLLKGYSINQRLMLAEERVDRQLLSHEKHLQELDSRNSAVDTRLTQLEKQVDFFVKANLPPPEGAIPAKSWWSGYEFAAKLMRSATKEVVIIDPFADDVALRLIAKRAPGVNAIVYSARVNRTMNEEIKLMNREKPHVNSRNMQNVHDRFIIIDETVYHIGASIRDLDNKLTAFSVLSLLTKAQLLGMIK